MIYSNRHSRTKVELRNVLAIVLMIYGGFTISVKAQNMSFLGLSMKQSPYTFAQRLMEQGFQKDNTVPPFDARITLKGVCFEEEDATIRIYSDPTNSYVTGVYVTFECITFQSQLKVYSRLLDRLEALYPYKEIMKYSFEANDGNPHACHIFRFESIDGNTAQTYGYVNLESNWFDGRKGVNICFIDELNVVESLFQADRKGREIPDYIKTQQGEFFLFTPERMSRYIFKAYGQTIDDNDPLICNVHYQDEEDNEEDYYVMDSAAADTMPYETIVADGKENAKGKTTLYTSNNSRKITDFQNMNSTASNETKDNSSSNIWDTILGIAILYFLLKGGSKLFSSNDDSKSKDKKEKKKRKKYICPDCGLEFDDFMSMRDHLNSVHDR